MFVYIGILRFALRQLLRRAAAIKASQPLKLEGTHKTACVTSHISNGKDGSVGSPQSVFSYP